jgi:protein-tyrosine kinase
MSRIHDALRKAEQTCVTHQPPSSELEPLGYTALADSAAPRAGSILTSDPEMGRNESPNGVGSLRAFAEQCPQTEWAPDPATILFYGEEFRTPGSEEFRTLRSRLDLVRERQSLQTLLITSAMPGEGKTFVAANLAQVIVWQRERHVLLIDGDLRSSQLHRALGVDRSPGLSDYLSGDASEFEVVKRGPLGNFFFIPGGRPAANASELIAHGRFRTLLKRLAVAFDWIIIDSPPVIPLADARLMAEFCDGVLLVVRNGETQGDLAQVAHREFRGKPFVGVVLNGVDPRTSYGYDYYQYGNTERKPRSKAGKL